jgi:hypothetical protein
MKCEHCGKERKRGEKGSVVEWANRTRGYKRERSDWLELCVKCHAKYDGITITNRPHSYAKYQTEKCRCEICRADYMAHKKTWPSTEYWSRADIRKRQREARAKKSPKP